MSLIPLAPVATLLAASALLHGAASAQMLRPAAPAATTATAAPAATVPATPALPAGGTALTAASRSATAWSIPGFAPVPAWNDEEAWLNATAGPRPAQPGLATRDDWQFEGELANGRPNGRGLARDLKSGLTYEGRLLGVVEGSRTLWLWQGPVLATAAPGKHGSRYGPRYIARLEGNGWQETWTAPAPSALAQARQAASQPAPAAAAASAASAAGAAGAAAAASPCTAPDFVPAHFIAWQMGCRDGRLTATAQWFSPDLRHEFQAFHRDGQIVAAHLRLDHGAQQWSGTGWGAGLRLQGPGELRAAPPPTPGGGLARPQPLYIGTFSDGRPDGEGLCGSGHERCRFAAGIDQTPPLAWDLPPMPELDQLRAWMAELEQPGWKADETAEIDPDGRRASALGFWGRALFSGGAEDCSRADKRGSTVVADGGRMASGFQRYRGRWGACGPGGVGRIDYADGRRYIGQVRGLGSAMPWAVPQGLGLWIFPNGTQHVVRTEADRQHNLRAFNEAQGWWIDGSFDAKWNSPDGIRRMPDGSSFRGPLSDGQPAGRGIWQNATRTVRIVGTGQFALGQFKIHGANEVTLPLGLPSHTTYARPPGRYLPLRAKESAPLGVLAEMEPAPETLAGMDRGACPRNPPVPAGWQIDWSRCGTAWPSLLAYSPDGRFRLGSLSGDTWRELVERLPTSFRPPQRRWTADEGFEFASAQPLPRGKARFTDFTNGTNFTGLLPDGRPEGSGECARPANEGGGAEPCEFRAGQRIDTLHQQRQQRLALEAQQRELQRQARAEQDRRERDRREREAAQQRAREEAEEAERVARRRAEDEAEEAASPRAPSAVEAFAMAMGQVSAEMSKINAQRQREVAALAARNQAAIAAQQQARERAAQQQAEDRESSRRQRDEAAAEQEWRTRQAAAQADLRRRVAEADQAAAAERARLAAQTAAMNRQAANPAGGYSSPFETGARSAAAPGGRSDAGEYRASPEGVVICELKDAGRFSCTTTLGTTISGGPGQASGWRTPEEAVGFVGGCREPRRIPWRAGHEVFGCGSGVTGMPNYIDVAERLGVAVAGRQTYWCKPMEVGCSRTTRP